MYDTALISGMGKYQADRFDLSQSLITYDKARIPETALFQPDEKILPAFKIFLEPFSSSYDLAVSVTGHPCGDKDGNVLILFAPASFKKDSIHICVWIVILQRSVTPFFDVFIYFLVQVADRTLRYLGTPESFCDIFDPADRYSDFLGSSFASSVLIRVFTIFS